MTPNDRYAKIREALEMGPTPGPWGIWVEPVRDRHEAIAELTEQVQSTDPFVGKLFFLNADGKCPATTGCGSNSEANAAYIAACDPDTIRELLAERDSLAAENARLKEDRARFPDRPDDIGRMIEAHIENLKEGKKSAEALADKAFDRAFRAEAKLAEAMKVLDALDRVNRGVDWCDQYEQARRWFAARKFLKENGNGE